MPPVDADDDVRILCSMYVMFVPQLKKGIDPESSLQTTTTPKSSKMCRYGPLCTRRDCRFRHRSGHDRTVDKDSSADLSYQLDEPSGPAFVPMGLRVELTDEGKVLVKDIEEEVVTRHGNEVKA